MSMRSTQEVYRVELAPQVCPSCGSEKTYFTGQTVVHSNVKASLDDTQTFKHYHCGNKACKHHWHKQ